MVQLVLDVLLDVAAFCAGAFEFRTLVNLALTCKDIHEAIKPVLDTPILVWTGEAQGLRRELEEFLPRYDLSTHPRREAFRPLAAAWTRIQFIVSIDTRLLQDMMSETQYNRNINTLFPNLVAVIQHNTAWPGKWEVVLRRSVEDSLLSSIIQSASSTFRPSITNESIHPPKMYKSLDLYASHPLGCRRCHQVVPNRHQGTFTFDRVAVRFGSNIWFAGGTVESASISEIPHFCALASRFSSMASSGLSFFVIEGIDPDEIEGIMTQLQTWMQDPATPLSFITVIDPIGTDSNLLVAPYWSTMAEFYSSTTLSTRMSAQTPLLYWALTSIDYDPERDEIHLARWDQGSAIMLDREMWTESLISGMFGRRVHSRIKRRVAEHTRLNCLDES